MESAVIEHFQSIRNFQELSVSAFQRTLSYVLDYEYTGRTCIKELEKAEKTVLGVKFEQVFMKTFNLQRGPVFDTIINGIDVDIKHTCMKNWTIPVECYRVEGICILGQTHDTTCSLGIVKTRKEYMNSGENRDKKKTLNETGIKSIYWFFKDVPHKPLLSYSPIE